MFQTRYKKAQMKISFGMIFSIFLIILFIAFAVYAITKFINLQKTIQIESFSNNLQSDIDSMWKSAKGSQEETYNLPDKITAVCFTNSDFDNLIFRSLEFVESEDLEHLDILRITAGEDPYCISNTDGKVKLIIFKDFGDDLVTITRQN